MYAVMESAYYLAILFLLHRDADFFVTSARLAKQAECQQSMHKKPLGLNQYAHCLAECQCPVEWQFVLISSEKEVLVDCMQKCAIRQQYITSSPQSAHFIAMKLG